ncbi:uncharacterized protein IL334_005971 [Kwoniella shivajii]|uniref:Uncharacterized protein n=1 Tax=Kwoniella shivajii TaxID=564305 RepID=A0ABZ1D6P3_9TREE|nr:hypothetical protein IL334_005971 [Kwoniella shivajii]
MSIISETEDKIVSIDYDSLPHQVKAQFEGYKSQCEEVSEDFYSMKWEDIPTIIKNYIKEHPYETAFHVVNGVAFFAPGGIWGPALRGLGFTKLGPAAGTAASFTQSYLHPIISKSGFAICQSAKMGGEFGMTMLNAVFGFGSAIAEGSSWLGKWIKEGKLEVDDQIRSEYEELSEYISTEL